MSIQEDVISSSHGNVLNKRGNDSLNNDEDKLLSNTTAITANLSNFCKQILEVDKSIRFVGIANTLGSLITTEYRQGSVPLMTKQETSQYAIEAVLRAAIREEFESKIGRLEYSIGKYEKLLRATVPILLKIHRQEDRNKKFYLLLSFDIDSDAKSIIEIMILPFIRKKSIFFDFEPC